MIEVPATRLAPWQAEPRELWSLTVILEFVSAAFVGGIGNLEAARCSLVNMDLEPDARTKFKNAMQELFAELKELPVSPAILDQAQQILKQTDQGNRGVLIALSGQLERAIQYDLARHLFLLVDERHKDQWRDPEKWFGETAVNRFSSARRDMRDCVRCLAIEQSTASVFHAMRIVEHGLRDLAARLKLEPKGPVESENWKNLIDQIESAIRKQEQLPKSAQRAERAGVLFGGGKPLLLHQGGVA